MRGWIECMDECSADESFVGSEIFELTVNQAKKLFFDRGFTQAGIITDRGDGVINFFFKERKSDVFLASEVIEDSAFSDAGFPRNCFGSGSIEAFDLEEGE